MNERTERGSLFMLGFSTIITQIIVVREMLTLFSGNELVIGYFISMDGADRSRGFSW